MSDEKERWGLLDTKDNLWMGGDDGPKLFDDHLIARVAAQVLDVRLQQEPGRTRATVFREQATQIRDEIVPTMTTLTALKRIEDGGVL